MTFRIIYVALLIRYISYLEPISLWCSFGYLLLPGIPKKVTDRLITRRVIRDYFYHGKDRNKK